MITRINETKTLKHISCDCKCKFDSRKCNSNQKWNSDKCRCECIKTSCMQKKIIFGILEHVFCEIIRYLNNIADDLEWHEITEYGILSVTVSII